MTTSQKLYCYKWSGLTRENKKISGETHAISLNFAKVDILQKGIFLLSIRKKKTNYLKNKIHNQDLTIFFRQLATLLSSGIPILQSLDTLSHSQEKLKSIIHTLKNEIEAGKGFANSLKKFPSYFNQTICHLIQAGEQSGTLETMLIRVAIYQENMFFLKRQIKQILLYPAITSLIALTITSIMLIFVVPRFEQLFQNMQGSLPAFTQGVIFFSHFLCNYIGWLFGVLFGSLFLACYSKKNPPIKQWIDYLVLEVPLLGSILQKIILVRFIRTLATLLMAGIPIAEALGMTAYSSGNDVYMKAILELKSEILSGQQLNVAMSKQICFPSITTQMVKVGEESGSLCKMLDKVAEMYEADIDYIITQISHLLEPLIMVVLGVLIGGLVIAMYLPIFKLGTVI